MDEAAIIDPEKTFSMKNIDENVKIDAMPTAFAHKAIFFLFNLRAEPYKCILIIINPGKGIKHKRASLTLIISEFSIMNIFVSIKLENGPIDIISPISVTKTTQ